MASPLVEHLRFRAQTLQATYPDLRDGQALMNALWDLRPDLAEQILRTDADPFYLDARILLFWEFIASKEVQHG